ncbi:MAG: methylmalonyl-CoA mutase, partial [Selenomonadaceae bacterium]|nr:methylmalonyl-CoA mutase [Selenomonadaceae bacterium]
MSDEKQKAELDLQEIIKRAESQTNFPEVPLDEFTPPTYEEWKQACIELLKGAPFEKKMYTKTYEGITFEPMYFRNTTEDILPKNAFPGMDNYLRGARANGYVNQPWGIAQVADETSPVENNEVLKHEVDKGSTIYNVKVDTATLKAIDAKDADKVGDVGVSLTTIGDVETLLKDLKLDKYPLYVYAGESAVPMLALIVAAIKKNGGKVDALKGFIGADPIGELAANGKLNQSLDKLYDEAASAAKWAVKNASGLRTLMVKSDAYSNGGANDVQEIAYSLATAVAYIRALMERGLTIDEAASQIMFGFSMGENFFMQVAKL